MKYVSILVLAMFVCVSSYAQKHQFAVLGGYNLSDGFTYSAAYYFKTSNVLVGPVFESTTIKDSSDGPSYNVISPGITASVQFPMGKKMKIYPGMTGRYRTSTYRNGFEYGFVAGIVYKVIPLIAINIETGYRIYSTKNKTPVMGINSNTTGHFAPLLAGVRVLL